MANTIVTDVTQVMATNVTNLTAGLENGGKVSTGNEFSKILGAANEKVAKSSETGEAMNQSAQGTKIDKSSTKEIKQENGKDPVNNESDRKDVAKASIDTAKKIEDKVKETFEISDEELTSAMEALGMSIQDLLDPAKLKDLMAQLSGITDSISLITNAEVYNQVKEVMNFAVSEIDNLEADLGITSEQLNTVIGDKDLMNEVKAEMEVVQNPETSDFTNVMNSLQMEGDIEELENIPAELPKEDVKNVVSKEEVTRDNQQLPEEVTEEESVVVNSDSPVKVAVNHEDTTQKTNSNENVAAGVKDNQNADLGKTESFKEVEKAENDPLRNRNRGLEMSSRIDEGEVSRFNVANETVNFGETVTSSTQVNTVGELVETVTRYTSVDGNDIMSQVTESIKVNYTEDATSLEMQLHPASLGTVNMQVSSANGVVTAHIIVQNEAVKSALESQLITLTQTFEEQGHKVEAVEVSIANYDLNQGMNRDNGQNPSEREEKESFRVNGTRRRINMNDLTDDDEEIEEVTEEERIARDMMARNGNTVDYTV